MALYVEGKWRARVKILEDNSNPLESKFKLKVIETFQKAKNQKPHGTIFEIQAPRFTEKQEKAKWELTYTMNEIIIAAGAKEINKDEIRKNTYEEEKEL